LNGGSFYIFLAVVSRTSPQFAKRSRWEFISAECSLLHQLDVSNTEKTLLLGHWLIISFVLVGGQGHSSNCCSTMVHKALKTAGCHCCC
jgi:hypothetical protein